MPDAKRAELVILSRRGRISCLTLRSFAFAQDDSCQGDMVSDCLRLRAIMRIMRPAHGRSAVNPAIRGQYAPDAGRRRANKRAHPDARAAAVRTRHNPLRATRENLENGRIYYGYYCLMCHGERGDGNGPVGESYDPKPIDLGSSAISVMTDGQIYLGMLTGPGHDSVIIQTVPPDQRWPLVMYVRTFSARK